MLEAVITRTDDLETSDNQNFDIMCHIRFIKKNYVQGKFV
jgi:hypothetical protein